MSITPGPWIVTHELRDNDEAICDLVNNTWVVKGHHLPLGNCDADARLISAAPDIRRALEMYIAAGFGNSTDHAAQARAYDAAIEALAKSEGRI